MENSNVSEPVKGRVARILDEYSVVLNVGTRQGVRPGMRFVIYVEGDEIADPVSLEPLGRLELVKAVVQAVHIQETMTVVSAPVDEAKSESTTVLSARLAEASGGVNLPQRNRLSVRGSDISGTRFAGPIGVGDHARSILT